MHRRGASGVVARMGQGLAHLGHEGRGRCLRALQGPHGALRASAAWPRGAEGAPSLAASGLVGAPATLSCAGG